MNLIEKISDQKKGEEKSAACGALNPLSNSSSGTRRKREQEFGLHKGGVLFSKLLSSSSSLCVRWRLCNASLIVTVNVNVRGGISKIKDRLSCLCIRNAGGEGKLMMYKNWVKKAVSRFYWSFFFSFCFL